jgi:hypothetical protein
MGDLNLTLNSVTTLMTSYNTEGLVDVWHSLETPVDCASSMAEISQATTAAAMGQATAAASVQKGGECALSLNVNRSLEIRSGCVASMGKLPPTLGVLELLPVGLAVKRTLQACRPLGSSLKPVQACGARFRSALLV